MVPVRFSGQMNAQNTEASESARSGISAISDKREIALFLYFFLYGFTVITIYRLCAHFCISAYPYIIIFAFFQFLQSNFQLFRCLFLCAFKLLILGIRNFISGSSRRLFQLDKQFSAFFAAKFRRPGRLQSNLEGRFFYSCIAADSGNCNFSLTNRMIIAVSNLVVFI